MQIAAWGFIYYRAISVPNQSGARAGRMENRNNKMKSITWRIK
jgi:hypothetical protein